MDLSWCIELLKFKKLGLGHAFGPFYAAFFYYLGGYEFPFYIYGIIILFIIPYIGKIKFQVEVESNNIDLIETISDKVTDLFFIFKSKF